MDDDKKKKLMIAIVVVCLVLAVGITVITNSGGSSRGYDKNKKMTLMCVNPDCEAVYEVTIEEYRKTMMESSGGGMMMMMEMGPMAVECKECGEKSAYVAEVCEKCGEVFIPDYTDPEDYPDRCPECGYSKMEERYSKRKRK